MNTIVNRLLVLAGMMAGAFGQAFALPPPTFSDVPYGPHPRQVLDFWKAESKTPTPVVLFIHGGGWVKGHKKEISGVDALLASGISVVSINYRYTWQAQLEGVSLPIQWPMQDAARALQFVRSKSSEWNVDKARIAAAGTSAGGCTSLWLAFHEDMANPSSSDPVARESTRLFCVAAHNAQTSLDPLEMKKWTPNSRYGGHAFGLMDPRDLKTRDTRFAEFLERREELLPWIKEYSPIGLATADDPPVHLLYDSAPAIGKAQKDPTHTANFGVELHDKLKKAGVQVELVYPGVSAKHPSMVEFLIENLKAKRAVYPVDTANSSTQTNSMSSSIYHPLKTVNLWPEGRMPGKGASGPEERKFPEKKDALRIGDVSVPTLAVYPAAGKRAPAVVVCPGGAYSYVVMDKEGAEVAAWLNSKGIGALVLKYRVPNNREGALQDCQRALRVARAHANEWNIDPGKLGALGFSAGGNLVARASCLFDQESYSSIDHVDEQTCRPDFAVLVYPAYLDDGKGGVSSSLNMKTDIPPTAIVHSIDDRKHVIGSKIYHAALGQTKTPHEFFLYATGGHGYGMRSEAEAKVWPDDVLAALCKMRILNSQ